MNKLYDSETIGAKSHIILVQLSLIINRERERERKQLYEFLNCDSFN